MKSFIIFVIAICGIALALAFSTSNDQVVNFNYLIAQDTFKLSYLLVGAFISGFILALLCMSAVYMRLKLSVTRLKRKSSRQLAELEKLRTTAIKG